ncbi:glycosyl transferase family 1 [Actinomyces urogenitalis S6-C4]|nr:glycosyl transferase family 1 [Actinomyces urogenitalis S6-C4]
MVVEQLWQPVPGGSGTYIRELVQELYHSGARLAGLAAHHRRGPATHELGLPAALPVRFARLPRRVLYDSWNTLHRPRAEEILPGVDVIHATTWALPATGRPLVVTVHDVAFLRSPEHFTKRGNRYFHRALARTRREAAAVITPSLATADDCVAAGIPAHDITVIPHGVRTIEVSAADVADFRSRHCVQHPYILWTGTREPRKNLPGLLEAFSLVAAERSDLDLVLVGPRGWGDAGSARTGNVALSDRIHVLGHLSEFDLAAAYRGARAFCFPSHWEGFGLPVLEAMAYGTPVVTSRGTCMEEVVGSAGLLADPAAPGELAAQLITAAGPAHDEFSSAGLERASRFTWEACAHAHAEVYENLARGAKQ